MLVDVSYLTCLGRKAVDDCFELLDRILLYHESVADYKGSRAGNCSIVGVAEVDAPPSSPLGGFALAQDLGYGEPALFFLRLIFGRGGMPILSD